MSDARSANAIDRKLGARVRARRLEIGMVQEELAARLGVTFQQVQKYESGTNRIAASRLFKIAEILELPVAAFFDGLGKGRDREPETDLLATPGASELVRLFVDIKSVRLRRRVLELVRALDDKA